MNPRVNSSQMCLSAPNVPQCAKCASVCQMLLSNNKDFITLTAFEKMAIWRGMWGKTGALGVPLLPVPTPKSTRLPSHAHYCLNQSLGQLSTRIDSLTHRLFSNRWAFDLHAGVYRANDNLYWRYRPKTSQCYGKSKILKLFGMMKTRSPQAIGRDDHGWNKRSVRGHEK